MFTTNLIIGNIISLAAAAFTAMSSWAADTKRIYLYQTAQCLLLAVASVFFNSYAGIVTLIVCGLRNYLAAINRLGKKAMLLCLILVLGFGIAFNNRGWLGAIIIFANSTYTVSMYLAKREITIKLNIAVNLALWIFYEIFILDIPSIIADSIGLFVALSAIVRVTCADRHRNRI